MADNQPESGPAIGGVQPSTQPSTGSGSLLSGDVETLAKALRPIIAQEVERTVQSTKDKRIGKLEGQVGDFAEQLARMKAIQAEGFSEAQALRLMRLEATTEPNTPAEPPKVQGSTQATPSVDAHAVFAAMGYDPSGPEVTAALRSSSDFVVQVATLAALKTKAAPANPATMQPAGGGTAPVVSASALEAEYRSMTAKLPGGQAGVKARFDAKIAIRKKAQEAGVPSPV